MMVNTNVLGRGSSQFQQKKANEAKLGAYYTDPGHCERINKLFSFSEEEETSVLEPSMGNGLAVRLATGADRNAKIRIFGVEINATVAEEQQKNPLYESVLKADFLKEVFITNSCFSFVFANPPYMDDFDYDRVAGVKAKRTELLFLERCTLYLKANGILCWIIPHRIFIENSYIGYMLSRYEILSVYKMDDKEYQKWGQVVIIARKRPCSIGIFQKDREAYQQAMVLENIGYLPYEVAEEDKVIVPPSDALKVKSFRTIVFDSKAAQLWTEQHPEVLEPLNARIRAATGIKKGKGRNFYTPPKEPGAASVALLAACGIGSGLVGSVEDGNLHLQRGSVKIEKTSTIDRDGNSESVVEIERTFSVTRQIIIESNGSIRDITQKEETDKQEDE